MDHGTGKTQLVESLPGLPGANTLILGDAGTGKTHSIGTLVDSGLKVAYLALEPGLESLLGYWTDRGLKVPANLAWHTLEGPDTGFKQLEDIATLINQSSFKALANMSDPDRNKHNQFISLIRACNNFVDQRTGRELGPVNKWGTDSAFVVDGLTGVGRAAMSMVVGAKPTAAEGEWGMAMGQVEGWILKCTQHCKCHFVLIAHIEKIQDMILGGTRIGLATLGNKLAPKIPPMFSDVVYSYRDGDKFYWSTANNNVTTKIRNLPIADKLKQDFGQIVNHWRERQKGAEAPV